MDEKAQTLAMLRRLGLIAVVRGPSPDLALRMVEALVSGGVRAIEITYTTPAAAAVTRQLDRQYGAELLLGMGTLTRPEQVEEAVGAGARYLVSPAGDEELAQAMVASGRLTMVGALTPTEVLQAYRRGSDVVKLFPGSLGGPAYLRALRGPFPDIPLMPTGGVDAANVAEWFSAGAFAVGAGSNLCPAKLAQQGRFAEIAAIASQFVEAVRQAQGELGK
jgi:2-dehydro-3-deoxyphosphogluconate aldolase/(4S)-4-hydroxy-2-oxoglutarate aldolase